MSRFHKSLCAFCALSITYAYADAPAGMEEWTPNFVPEAIAPSPVVETTSPLAQPEPIRAAAPKPVVKAKAPELPFTAFTGKVKGRKVRMRLQADTDSHIVKELNKSELLTVVGEKGDFWAVEPISGMKAFVFRGFVFDNVIEANRVNVRLEPNLEAPIIGHFNMGDRIKESVISAQNNKWLEIAPPSESRFYVAKDYIEYAGGPEVKAQFDKRHAAVEQLLDTTSLLGQSELRKSFEEIDFDRISKGFHTIIDDYSDFSEQAEQAKEALASFQEGYLQKRIAYLEASRPTEESYATEKKAAVNQEISEALGQITDKMRIWEPAEESLYLSWASMNDKNDLGSFYEDQKAAPLTVSGILEVYDAPDVKNKPGDFIVRDHGLPVGYVYSTHVNLQKFVGQKVTLKAALRPNNNFAFPAYYALDVE